MTYYIPIWFKDYGRNRGCNRSAHEMQYLIERLIHSQTSEIINKHNSGNALYFNQFNFKDFNEINSDVKWFDIVKYKQTIKNIKKHIKLLWYNDIFVESMSLNVDSLIEVPKKEKILYNICVVQNPSQRGLYDINKKPNDIVFCKGNIEDESNEVVQAMLPAKVTNRKFYPKYYELSESHKIERATEKLKNSFRDCNFFKNEKDPSKKELKIRITWYNREDTSPIQTQRYRDFINTITRNDIYENIDFEIREIGYNNDINQYTLSNVLDTTDIFLYSAPDHKDPFPNTILHAISRLCLILNLDIVNGEWVNYTGYEGILELKRIFNDRFITSIDDYISYYTNPLRYKSYMKTVTATKLEVQQKLKSLDLLSHIYGANKLEEELKKLIKEKGLE